MNIYVTTNSLPSNENVEPDFNIFFDGRRVNGLKSFNIEKELISDEMGEAFYSGKTIVTLKVYADVERGVDTDGKDGNR